MTADLERTLADRYRIERELGRGGMATVYLAEDLKHGRRVALKVLHAELAAALGAERFLAEIQTTATLQHPHILPLFDSGEAAGAVFYVMPFVEGESLRQRLAREQQLPVEEAVRIAQQVAHALDFAHRHGVIHRDIKPENILLQDGEPLVADFGVALAVTSAGGTRLTQTGLSVGTPQYMSPEQAAAEREVDARADIYALGAVLYEMLAGAPPYTGPNATAITARKMTEPVPRLRTVRDTVPDALELVVRKALARTPADRFATAQQFAGALEAVRANLSGTNIAADPRPVVASAWRVRARVALPWIVAAVVIAWGLRQRGMAVGGAAMPARLTMPVQPIAVLVHASSPAVAVSPDGSRIAYVAGDGATGQLYLRRLDSFDAAAVSPARDVMGPFFSPDGEWLAYLDHADTTLKKIRLADGTVYPICKAPDMHGATWGSKGIIVIGGTEDNQFGLARVSADGGEPEIIARSDRSKNEPFLLFPSFLPDGETVLFTVAGSGGHARRVDAINIRTRERHEVLPKGGNAQYVSSGHLIYAEGGALYRIPFDARRVRASGTRARIVQDVLMDLPMEPAVGHFGVSLNGVLVYLPGAPAARLASGLAWVSRKGAVEPLRDIGVPLDAFAANGATSARIAPDGREFLISGRTGNTDPPLPNRLPVLAAVWLYDLDRASLSKLANAGPQVFNSIWMPDGRRIVAQIAEDSADAVSLFILRADGMGAPQRITRAPDRRYDVPYSVTADGKLLFYYQHYGGRAWDVWVTPLDGSAPPRALFHSDADEGYPAISPDGRWLAYVSNESGRSQVYLTDFPGMRRRWQVSADGGQQPLWNRNGRELFFNVEVPGGLALYAVAVAPESSAMLGKPVELFRGPFFDVVNGASIVPAPAGDRFLAIQQGLLPDKRDHLNVILNVAAEFSEAGGGGP